MQIKILASLLFFQSFVSCQQGPDQALLSEANSVLYASVSAQPVEVKTRPATTNVVFKSTDGGQTWQDVSAGLPGNVSIGRVLANDGKIFLSTEKALYHSDCGSEAPIWEKETTFDIEISGLFSGQTGPYISSYEKGFFKKVGGTDVLIPLHRTLKDKTVRTVLEAPDGSLFVGCESGLYKSTDSGNNWKQVFSEVGVNSLVAAEGVLICGTYKGLMRSTDGGDNWDYVLTEDGSAWNTSHQGGRFFSLTQGGNWQDHPINRLRMSADGGKTWQRVDESLSSGQFIFTREVGASPSRMINDIKLSGQYLFCSNEAGIFRSSDWGKSWEPVFTESGLKLLQLAVSGNAIYAVKVIGC
ncbi:MAG: hypothetical protein Q7T20_17615 [Saprospiraceae bacterium]|nr:hypothetical protein [Saprospiraceae bacterium]